MAYKCLECGYVFSEYEIDRWVEEVGEYEGQPCMESHGGCPMCHGDFEEAERCKVCNGYHLSNELHGGVCDECIDEYRKDFDSCYEISLGEKETIKINSLLATLFDEGDIQAILIEYIKTKCPDIDCSEYIDEDISWFGEQVAKEVKKR